MSSTEIRIHIFIHEESVAVHEELLLADSQAGGRKRSGFVRSLLLLLAGWLVGRSSSSSSARPS